MRLQAVAEPSVAPENGLLVASLFDLAATKAKALLDRSEWRDSVDIASLIESGHALANIIGYAAAVFDPLFLCPAPVFLRNLVWCNDGTAPDVPAASRSVLEAAVRGLDLSNIPLVEPWRGTIDPVSANRR